LRGEPRLEAGLGGCDGGGKSRLAGGDFLFRRGELGFLLRSGQEQRGLGQDSVRIADQAVLVDAVEKRTHRVVVLRGDWVVFVVVAAGALEGERHETGADGVHAVGNAVLAEFFGHRAAFVGFAVDAAEGGGEFLVAGGVWQKVAGELLTDKLVERQVVIEGLDHPIAVGPGVHVHVGLIAKGVGVTRDIKPRRRHALAETWRS